MQALAATLLVDRLDAIRRQGGEQLLRDRLAELSDDERRVLREALLAEAPA
jgi:hypothetical protein